MSKNEKYFFRRYALLASGRDNNQLLALFNMICASGNVIDETALKEKFGTGNFKVFKSLLKQKIIESLQLNQPENSTTGFYKKIEQVYLLAGRNHAGEARLLLSGLIKELETGDGDMKNIHLQLALIAAVHIETFPLNDYSNTNAVKCAESMLKNTNRLNATAQLHLHYRQLNYIINTNPHLRSEKQRKEYVVIKRSVVSIPLNYPLSTQDRYYLLASQSAIAFIEADFQKHLFLESKLYSLTIKNKEKLRERSVALNSLAWASFMAKDVKLLERVIMSEKMYFKNLVKISVAERIEWYFCITIVSLIKNNKNLSWSSNLNFALYEQVKEINDRLVNLSSCIIINEYNLPALNYRTIKNLCTLILQRASKTEHCHDVCELAELFKIIILFETEMRRVENDFRSFLLQLESYKNKVFHKYNKADHQLEILIINYLEKGALSDWKGQKKVFEKLSEELKVLKKRNVQYIKHIFAKFDFLKWVENLLKRIDKNAHRGIKVSNRKIKPSYLTI